MRLGEFIRSDLSRDQDTPYDGVGVGEGVERDAVGDIVISLADWAYRADVSVHGTIQPSDAVSKDVALSTAMNATCTIYVASVLSGDTMNTSHELHDLLCDLAAVCEHKGYDFHQCVYERWGEVAGDDSNSSLLGDT